MKSIMEEASSIAKAIETAWNRAGQPTEFTVKVLELPQTSFFGLKTSKSAKVAFFFNEATVTVRAKESAPQRQPNQRPVTLRQPGNKAESSDQQRRPQQNRYDNRGSQEGRESSDSRQPRETRELRDQREPREPREASDYAKASTDRRDNRNADNRESYDQRQDQRNRSQAPRRLDHAKSPDSRSSQNSPSAHSEEHRSDASRRTAERPEQGQRREYNKPSDRPDYAKTSPDRQDDSRPRHDSERSEHSSYSQEPRESWTPEMAQIAHEWIKETLVLMGKPDITVNTQVSYNYLKVNLSAPVLEDMRQEETQLKSWGMLAMEAVREKAGKPLRSLRIILESNK